MTEIDASRRAQGNSHWMDAAAGWAARRASIPLVLLGPVLAVSTIVILGERDTWAGSGQALRAILIVDVAYLVMLGAVIVVRIAGLISARRRGRAGSKLHLRLAGVFAAIALVPTVIVAIFATASVNFGMESWFSDRVGTVVRNSLTTAEAYEREHRANIRGDVLAMANDLNRAASQGLTGRELQELVVRQALVRELPETFVFNAARERIPRGDIS